MPDNSYELITKNLGQYNGIEHNADLHLIWKKINIITCNRVVALFWEEPLL